MGLIKYIDFVIRKIISSRLKLKKISNMTSFSSTHHAGKGFMYVNKDIFPHHQPMTVEKRGHLTPTKQIQQFKYTFREQLYSDPHYNPTSLAFTEKEVKRRATLTGKKLPEERRQA